jgi:malonyl-CoA O-methyltransferase
MAIKERFNRAATTYSHYSEIQSITAQQLIQPHILNSPQHVLDIGAGTGILTKKLAKKYPNSIIHAIDISENMLQELTHFNVQNIHTKCIDYLDYFPVVKFDLIVSNAVLHWMDTEKAIKKISTELNKNGETLLTIFGSKSSNELSELLPKINRKNDIVSKTFKTQEDVVQLGKENFSEWHVDTKIITIPFNSLNELFNVQQKTGVNDKLQNDGLWTPRQLDALMNAFQEAYGQIQLSYEVHFCRGKQNGE